MYPFSLFGVVRSLQCFVSGCRPIHPFTRNKVHADVGHIFSLSKL
jgi:hypothetical protein